MDWKYITAITITLITIPLITFAIQPDAPYLNLEKKYKKEWTSQGKKSIRNSQTLKRNMASAQISSMFWPMTWAGVSWGAILEVNSGEHLPPTWTEWRQVG